LDSLHPNDLESALGLPSRRLSRNYCFSAQCTQTTATEGDSKLFRIEGSNTAIKRQTKRLQAAEKNPLVLDGVLWAIVHIRKQFKLQKLNFRLEQIESVEAARKALGLIIQAAKGRHGSEIYSKGHSLLEELGPEIYAKNIKGSTFSGYRRISPSHVDRALRRVFEIALQTLSELPARDLKVQRSRDKLISLASQLSRLANKLDPVIRADKRIRVYLPSVRSKKRIVRSKKRMRLDRLSTELRWAAEMLKTVYSETRIVKLGINSPNPQVRFALYLAEWIEACTGRKYYKYLQTLAAAALAAADEHREHPKWLDRLEIEMTRKMNKRRRWRERLRALRKVRVLPY